MSELDKYENAKALIDAYGRLEVVSGAIILGDVQICYGTVDTTVGSGGAARTAVVKFARPFATDSVSVVFSPTMRYLGDQKNLGFVAYDYMADKTGATIELNDVEGRRGDNVVVVSFIAIGPALAH